MRGNKRYKPRHNPNGKYEHICGHCKVIFRTNNRRTEYCCFAHKQAVNNSRWYKRHSNEHIKAVLLRAARKRIKLLSTANKSKAKKQRQDKNKSLDQMTEAEIIQFIQQNPHAVSVRK